MIDECIFKDPLGGTGDLGGPIVDLGGPGGTRGTPTRFLESLGCPYGAAATPPASAASHPHRHDINTS